ncbi:sigma-54-dependent transcriptional regulator [Salisediminibacterium selenitireducens]|uniref:Two component, sigma54 specific, transcriptional regulator, Fis family n=1 Tax=Bacillus selenitireducens (strain ATCC 700615 / DSM 15326 / MLS10) TaxID=439292 RepID=D6XY22_BACIE|nr:sigma-54 dependent transcriptional regulator [Salisediminibacterium selenitireducens]ADH98095.1 putative two component, sigma54 specific, transcriptional regulator, Fis family [[Bacillus] selenitireducens MLS10]
MERILVADDEQDLRELLVSRLKRKGFEVFGAADGEEALALLQKERYDLGIFDIRMEPMDGLTLLEEVKSRPDTLEMEVVMLTGHGTMETAIEAMKRGAYDYLTKPYNLSELEVVISKALEKKKLTEDNQTMRNLMHARDNDFDIVGKSSAVEQVKHLIRRVADADASILIEGESGTGKELVAKGLHYWSKRAAEPFVAVNAGAIPDQLIESELFGHVKGAFTGAQKDKKGLVEVADQGTLFLDEIGEMPLDMQVKLLRFLETGSFRRVGETKERHVQVRTVAATNRSLIEEAREGRFREDLFYRLQVMTIEVPPLRDRKEDIPLLADYFLSKQGKAKRLTDTAMKQLMSYDFPGNIRELMHILERGCLLCPGAEIEGGDLMLPGTFQDPQDRDSVSPVQTLEEVERDSHRPGAHLYRLE